MSTKKLISYNSEKHPEVARFFERFEDTNLTSHYVREAIVFYEQHKSRVTVTTGVPITQVEPARASREDVAKGKYERFDPTMLD